MLLFATVWGARRWDGARPWVLGSVTMALLALGTLLGVSRPGFGNRGLDPSDVGQCLRTSACCGSDQSMVSRGCSGGSIDDSACHTGDSWTSGLLAGSIDPDGRAFGGSHTGSVTHTTLPPLDGIESIVGPVAEIPLDHPMFLPEHPAYRSERVAN